ncbi:MAG TPA: ricin-type beta-trefoil lectin domain protein [Actinoplanes sp.]
MHLGKITHAATEGRRRKRGIFVAALAAVLAAVSIVAAGPALSAAAPLRIMALGDSITAAPGCWRALLWQRLRNSGYTNMDFVGTQPASGCGFTYDGEHEGHSGYLVTNVANQNLLPGWLSSTRPDIVLMHFATNDVWNNIAPSTITAAWSKLVDQMRASNPNMKIIVAKILPMNPTGCSDCPQRVINLNNTVQGWANGKTTSASPITVVDQWSGFSTSSDTGDGVHPNSAGFQKMADRWYPAVAAALSGTVPTTPTTGPTPPGGSTGVLRGVGSNRCIDVPGATTTNSTQVVLWDCNGQTNQRWTYTATKQLQVYGTKCLDGATGGDSAGDKVQIYDCNGASNQQWNLNSNGTVSSVKSGLCLDVVSAATANNSPIALWTCSGGTNQRWSRS